MAQTKLEDKKDELSKDGIRRRITRSKLRKTLNALHALEPKCLENIEKVVNGGEVDKEVVSTSRWVVTQLQSLTKAALQDELEYNSLRFRALELEQEDQEQLEEEKPSTRFSLHMLPTAKDV